MSSLIRQAAPTDLFAKALTRNRYQFNDQFDIGHVGEKYPKLATQEFAWLRKRLGRAITQRRHYLNYIQDHSQELKGVRIHKEIMEPKSQAPASSILQLPVMKSPDDSISRPSTFFTKATSLAPGHITPQMLVAEEESDPENDARSYTTISRSVEGDLDSSTTARIPKLSELRVGFKKEVECPFCFRIKKFKSERVWRQHVFSDLRPYICTFSDCEGPYFGDINEWFRHEMQNHRVSYTCRLCQSNIFLAKERYLAHVQKNHPVMLEDGEEQLVLDIAKSPLNQIPAQDCPCCSEWTDRLKERTTAANMPSPASNNILAVEPTLFKRHLASHLEQLALFAIPIDTPAEGDIDSDAAVQEDVAAPMEGEDDSDLSFQSPKPLSLASKEQSSDQRPASEELLDIAEAGTDEEMRLFLDRGDEVHITEAVVKAAAGNPFEGTEILTLLLDRRGDETHITEDVMKTAASNNIRGTGIIELLLNRKGEEIRITEEIVKAAVSNKRIDEELLTRLLDRGGDEIHITEEIVMAAVSDEGNEGRAKGILTLLLDRRGDEIRITEKIIETAARNGRFGDTLLDLLLRRKGDEIRSKVLNSQNNDELISIFNVAARIRDQGQTYKADELELNGILAETKRGALGWEDPETLHYQQRLAIVYQDVHMFSEAEELQHKVVGTREKVLGKDHPDTLDGQEILVSIYLRQGKLGEAQSLQEQILETGERLHGPEHNQTVTAMVTLGNIYADQKKLEKAEEIFLQALEGYCKTRGENHYLTLDVTSWLARCYADQGKLDQAETMYKQALRGYEDTGGMDTFETLDTARTLARLYATMKRPEEAKEFYQRALDGFRKNAPTHTSWANACAELEAEVEAFNRDQEAQHHEEGST